MSVKKPLGISLLIGLLALAFAALPAFASAATVTLHSGTKTGTKLANGTAIKGFSSNLVFHTAAGNLECAENELLGTVGENGTEKTALNIASGRFQGASKAEACKTTIEGGAVNAVIKAENLPWKDTLLSNGTDSLTGTGGGVKFTSTLRVGTTPIAVCVFERASVATTYNFNTAMTATVVASPAQTFTGSGAGCPASGFLTGSFAITTGSPTFATAVVATTP